MPSIVRETVVRLARSADAVFEVACLAPWGPVADQISAAGVRVWALDAQGQHDLLVVHRLARLIERRRFDTVFSFLVHANAAAAAVAPRFGHVRFLQCIQTTQTHPSWHWRVQAVVYRAAERVVAPSESVCRALMERSRIPASRITLIPNAVATEDFSTAPWPSSRPFPIGFIGRLDPVKRLPDLLEAVKLLEGAVHLHIFGEGAERANVEDTIKRLGIGRDVTLRGAVSRPQVAHQQIGMLVLPSIAEGLPMVLIEAMAARLPIVATQATGIIDVIRHEHNGLLVPTRSPPALARAIARLISDGPLRQSLVDRGREDVERQFAWPAVLARYADVLQVKLVRAC